MTYACSKQMDMNEFDKAGAELFPLPNLNP